MRETPIPSTVIDLSPDTVAWKWFEYHAKQRLELFKFYMTAYAASLTFASILYEKSQFLLALILAACSIVLSFVFWQLDVRSRRLIEIGEKIMIGHGTALGFPDHMNPFALSQNRTGGIRYKTGFRILFLLSLLVSFGAIAVGAQPLIESYTKSSVSSTQKK